MAGMTDTRNSDNSVQHEFWGTLTNHDTTSPQKMSPQSQCPSPPSSSPYYCDVCRIEMTGPEPYNQHLLGSNHAKQFKRQSMQHGAPQINNSVITPLQVDVAQVSGPNYHCTICNVTMSGIEPFLQHVKGMQHLKRQRRLEHEKIPLLGTLAPAKEENLVQRQENIQQPVVINNQLFPVVNNQLPPAVPQYYCTICSIAMSGIEPYNQHMRGIPHQKRAKNQEQLALHIQKTQQQQQQQQMVVPNDFTCKLCNKVMSGYEPYTAHMNGSQHAKEVNRRRLVAQSNMGAVSDQHATMEIPASCRLTLRCDVCVKTFSGVESLQEHFQSLKHQKKVSQEMDMNRMPGSSAGLRLFNSSNNYDVDALGETLRNGLTLGNDTTGSLTEGNRISACEADENITDFMKSTMS